MTAEEAKRNQDEIAKHYNLGHWYGTNCEKCCGVYPKLMVLHRFNVMEDTWYECEVCGKRTRKVTMPWIAREEWNAGKYEEQQMSIFERG